MKAIIDNKAIKNCLYILLGTFSVAIFLKNAWVAEDGFILLRSVDQFLHGNGFRWNPHERTQVYTSPLWYLLVIASTAVCKTLYLNIIGLSLALHVALLFTMARLLQNVWRWSFGVLLLTMSQAYFDFTSSGLEYPLIYLLLSSFILLYLREQHKADHRWLAITAGLALITRHDLLFLLSPMLLHLSWCFYKTLPRKQLFLTLCIFLAPLSCWTLFSLIYYGFPFPNTAYAKLAIQGLPQMDRFVRGYTYAWVSLKMDPITPTLIAFALIQGLFSRNTQHRSLGASIAIAFLYVTWIGADYMQGRFYAPIYLAAVLGLISNDKNRFYIPDFLAPLLGQQSSERNQTRLNRWTALLMCGLFALMIRMYGFIHLDISDYLLIAAGFTDDDTKELVFNVFYVCGGITFGVLAFFFQPIRQLYLSLILYLLFVSTQILDGPWYTSYTDYGRTSDYDVYVATNTISRERYWIYRWTSLYAWFHRDPNITFPDHDWCHLGQASDRVSVIPGAGMQGYCMPLDHIGFDYNGLVDPLMARMPKFPTTVWVPGGAIRIIPDGYVESLIAGKNLFEDPDLARYYDKLSLITQSDDLFSPERLRTIIAFNVGAYEGWLQAYVTRLLENPPPPPPGW